MKQCGAVAFVFFGCVLGGCAVGPDYRALRMDVPDEWHEAAETGLVKGSVDVERWWEVFKDETLTTLIGRAAENNLDARMAVLRIRQARALRGVAAGELLPSLSAQGSFERSKASANAMPGGLEAGPHRAGQFTSTVARGVATGTISQAITNTVPGSTNLATPLANGLVGLLPGETRLADAPETDLYTTGFDASWEIDVFGGIRRNVEATDADLAAAVEDYHGVLVSLFSEVATTYVDLRTLQAQIAATAKNIDLQKETLLLTRSLMKHDLASELEVHQAETNLATTESQLPLLEAGMATAIYRLSVLVGREPSALYEELVSPEDIPTAPEKTCMGVPADVLRQRPDIRAAERRLAAETARIGVATANLYPRFTLSGTLGFQSTDFNHLLDNRSISYGFGPSVRWNLFEGLRDLNRIASQETAAHMAYVTYEQSVLTALMEVESAMVAYKREQARMEALSRATESARRTVKLARTRYEDGLTDFQDVVDAERSLVNLETSLLDSNGQVAMNLVAIYKALGGGWKPGVTAQAEYLEGSGDALDSPMEFFFSGGKTDLPWGRMVDEELIGDEQQVGGE